MDPNALPPADPLSSDAPALDPTALFLGPQGQNAAFLEACLLDAVRDHVHWRRGYHAEDPDAVDPFRQSSPAFRHARARLERAQRRLMARLKGSVPFHSPRYLGHMAADTLLPAQVGYLAAMLYNPNNVALEGSPITSRLEEEVGQDLAELLGFDPEAGWAHLCAGGTLANMEALWIMRNLALAPLRQGPGGREQVGRLRPDRLLELLELPPVPLRDAPPLAVLAPATCHYSWSKAMNLLGLGEENLVLVPLDERFLMDADALEAILERLAAEGRPVLAAVGVVGTTEGGGVDPIHRIIEARRRHEARHGRWFFVHVDAAYGGYARALFRDTTGALRSLETLAAEDLTMREDLHRAMAAIPDTDSVTIDPHKLGFIPYPAGGLVMRDRRWRKAVACHAPYINHGAEDHAGSFVLEGSRPGAAASACWLAHRAVPLDASGYGAILGESFRAARRLAAWLDGRSCAGHRCAVLAPPDLDILLYAFAPEEGSSLEAVNDCSRRLLEALPPTGKGPFALTSTTVAYGQVGDAVRPFLRRLGIPDADWREGASLLLLRSVMMTPFVADPGIREFYRAELLEALEDALRRVTSVKG